jgi:hypothetical protein
VCARAGGASAMSLNTIDFIVSASLQREEAKQENFSLFLKFKKRNLRRGNAINVEKFSVLPADASAGGNAKLTKRILFKINPHFIQ